ncbi:hypothetical protein J6590_089483 [Homalodisca vitripennis]|nr:hypothetical protein J6590_089483 [Homalodisca vitripennis]
MIFISLIFGVVLIKSLVTTVACDNRGEARSAMEKRIGYEDGKITSVTVYTGDHKPTGQTSGSGTSGGSGSSQSNPPPTFSKPSTDSTTGRPKPENQFGNFGFNFKPFGTFGGLRPQDLWFQELSSIPSKIASFSDIDDYEDTMENILNTLDSFNDY